MLILMPISALGKNRSGNNVKVFPTKNVKGVVSAHTTHALYDAPFYTWFEMNELVKQRSPMYDDEVIITCNVQ